MFKFSSEFSAVEFADVIFRVFGHKGDLIGADVWYPNCSVRELQVINEVYTYFMLGYNVCREEEYIELAAHKGPVY